MLRLKKLQRENICDRSLKLFTRNSSEAIKTHISGPKILSSSAILAETTEEERLFQIRIVLGKNLFFRAPLYEPRCEKTVFFFTWSHTNRAVQP